MSRLTTKDRKEQRREAIRLLLIDDHLIATGQVALRGGVLDNLIELTAEQLILRRSPIVRKELAKFTTAKKIDLINEALTQDMPESSNAIAEYFGELYSARSERNEIVHRTWRATDTSECSARSAPSPLYLLKSASSWLRHPQLSPKMGNAPYRPRMYHRWRSSSLRGLKSVRG
jgi:hypothetical protein